MNLAPTPVPFPSHSFLQCTLAQHASTAEQQLAALAGDLRGPLRTLEDCSLSLRRQHANRLNPEGQRMLSTVSDELSRTGRLLDGLLTYTAVANRQMACVRLDMTQLAGSVYETLTRISPNEGLEFRLETLPTATGDASMLRHVFFNLLSNAFKFTRGVSHPLVHVRGIQRDGWHDYSVQDNGVGFDTSRVSRLFSAFERLSGPANQEGTGLGLAIVERIVRRHGGRVWAESLPGHGAKFSFSLPVR